MKAKLLIIGFLIVCLICAFAFIGHAQTYVYGSKEGNVTKIVSADSISKILIAEETWLKFSNADAKITTTLESIFMRISVKFGTEFKKVMITYKHANGQPYKEYTITIPRPTAANLINWAKTNL